MAKAYDEIRAITERIYGTERGMAAFERIDELLDCFEGSTLETANRFSQADTVLITYGDTIIGEGDSALRSLHTFAARFLKESFSAIHILPFFPFSSDDGFSVIDYKAVNPSVGTWQDVERIGKDFSMMFDFVLNHISAKSTWFQRYLANTPGYQDLAIEVSPHTDLSMVTRPRALPLLTPVKKTTGEQTLVWTTFSADQIDLNYTSLDVLIKMVEVLLFYIKMGGRLIRMDAVAYLWKQIGTSCIHLHETHDMVRLFRKVLDQVAPESVIITETNVPHPENISYFGNGYDEAQMVYNFTLPPLLLYTFETGDVSKLNDWAKALDTPSEQTTFFNFTASHDGIGVRPVEGILSSRQIDQLVQLAVSNGGQVSYKQNSDGTKSPYELNITYLDAMGGNPDKFLASQAIAMILPGVPAVYIHSLLGSRNWYEGVEMTGRARTINRRQIGLSALLEDLGDANSSRAEIFYPYCRMLTVRRQQPAFHPNADFDILHLTQQVMGVRRANQHQKIYALTNVVGEDVSLSLASLGIPSQMRDLLSDQVYNSDRLQLKPYQSLWLEG